MRKITKRSVKGISPVISVLFMIALAVTAALVTYAWVSGYIDFTTTKVEKTIQIQSVSENAVYVQNTGNTEVELANLYVDGKLEPWASIAVGDTPGQTTLDPGETATIFVSPPLPRDNAPRVTIKIVTAGGTSVEHTETFLTSENSPTEPQFTITASAGTGGSISPSGAVKVTQGNDRTFTINPDSSYHILDVLVDGTSVGATNHYTFNNVNSDHTITATFEENEQQQYTITASAGAGGTITPTGAVPVTDGNDQSFNINPNSGYHIASILVDGNPVSATTQYTFYDVNSDHTISVTFQQTIYTITASASAGGSISPSGAVQVIHGNDQSFNMNPSSGYHIASILVDGNPVGTETQYTFYDVDSDHTISVTFQQTTYTITASASAGGSISPSGAVQVIHGNDQSFNMNPNSGYRVVNVLVDGTSVGDVTEYTFYDVTAAHTISATFDVIPPETLVLRPTGTGSLTENYNNGWYSNWECVDDTTPDETYIYDSFQSSDYATDTYTTADHSSESGTITSVTIHILARQEQSYNNYDQSYARVALRIGGTTYYGNAEDLTGSWVDYSFAFDTNPAGGTWGNDWTIIDSMQIGVSLMSADTYGGSDGTCYARCTQVYVVIEYTPEQ